MAHRLLDKNGNEVAPHDLQDKRPLCIMGASFEEVFISKYGAQFQLIINPAKIIDKYAPDLLNLKTKNLVDLKTQNTPFFRHVVDIIRIPNIL